MSALRLINETEITSSVSSVDITDVFSADFDIYKITTSGFTTASTTQTDLDMRFINASGSIISASNYDYALLNLKAETSYSVTQGVNQTKIEFPFGNADDSPEGSGSVVYVFNPFSTSSYSFILWQAVANVSAVHRNRKGIGVLKQTASMTGFRVVLDQNLDEGVIRTYGLRVDNG